LKSHHQISEAIYGTIGYLKTLSQLNYFLKDIERDRDKTHLSQVGTDIEKDSDGRQLLSSSTHLECLKHRHQCPGRCRVSPATAACSAPAQIRRGRSRHTLPSAPLPLHREKHAGLFLPSWPHLWQHFLLGASARDTAQNIRIATFTTMGDMNQHSSKTGGGGRSCIKKAQNRQCTYSFHQKQKERKKR